MLDTVILLVSYGISALTVVLVLWVAGGNLLIHLRNRGGS